MIFFETVLTLSNVARYMATLILPEDFRNMQIEEIHLSTRTLNSNGTQSLKVTYTQPGRVEDFDLDPDMHAFRMIQTFHPKFQIDKVEFMPYSSKWLWSQEQVRIYFVQKEMVTSPSGEFFDTEEANISLSRQRIFISYGIIQEYLLLMLAELGMDASGTEVPVHWDENKAGLLYQHGNTLVLWVLECEEEFQDLIYFAGLEQFFRKTDEAQRTSIRMKFEATRFTARGLEIPIVSEEMGTWK
ncbi:MAG: hypothetical protein J6J31_07115 [Thermoguttaceae bacterium]|nr:hypothetical protein [Thermoguttaceae bacterium]